MNVQIRGNVVPSWSDELIKKTTESRNFNRATELLYLIMDDDRKYAEREQNYISEEAPTALENLYVIVLLMLRFACQQNP